MASGWRGPGDRRGGNFRSANILFWPVDRNARALNREAVAPVAGSGDFWRRSWLTRNFRLSFRRFVCLVHTQVGQREADQRLREREDDGKDSEKAGGASALGLAFGVAMMMAQAASGAVEVEYDFADLADVDGETFGSEVWARFCRCRGRGVRRGTFWEKSAGTGTLGVSATGYNSSGASKAYLDKDLPIGGNRAGLGVCAVANSSNECNPSNDDNVSQIGGTGGSGFETLVLDLPEMINSLRVEFATRGILHSRELCCTGSVVPDRLRR